MAKAIRQMIIFVYFIIFNVLIDIFEGPFTVAISLYGYFAMLLKHIRQFIQFHSKVLQTFSINLLYLSLLIFYVTKFVNLNLLQIKRIILLVDHLMKQDVSESTKYRYTAKQRQKDLPSFAHFKRQYSKYFSNSKIAEIKKAYQHGLCGRNQHRHTVVVDRIGNIKVQDVNKLFQEEELVSYTNQRLLQLSEQILEERQQIIWIIDLNGKIMQLASKKILDSLQKIIANVQKYFPDILYRLVFVNTPMLFDTIWSKIAPFISKETLQKVMMIGDQIQNIYEFAEPSILPQFLGGELDEQTFLAIESPKKIEKHSSEHSEEEDEQIDFSSLKLALSGLKVGGNSLKSVSQTPLNTEADDK